MNGKVFVQRAKPGKPEDAEQAIYALFAGLPEKDLPNPKDRVLIKPNLLARHTPDRAVTTHPDVLRAVILALQQRGIFDITVADSPGGPYTPMLMEGMYKTCGYLPVCEQTGAKLYTACESEGVDCPGRLVHHFELLKPVLEADYILNLPKFKTHVLTGMSGAVKNLLGCVPGLHKAEFHMRFPQKELFGQMLVDLCEMVKPRLHIVDGIIGMEGDGPAGGRSRAIGLLLASTDPYSLDLAICRYMGLPPGRVPTLVAARENGLCEESFDPALLVGEEVAKRPIEAFLPPRSYEGRVDFSGNLPGFLQGFAPFVNRIIAPRPAVRKKDCVGCGKCAEICPQKVIELTNAKAHMRQKECIRCFCCHEICPVKAIDVRTFPLFRI
ncbi:DUF362 domain-containing protein [Ruminococcaceae bacterium OttesenSCG-928-I18]|nr:DUF362 domain-containing protein [Ruminococcaceae bacterium OttesenSCG-928-I18]